MAPVTVTIRPNGARTEVKNLPYTRSGDGYTVIGDAIGATRRDQVTYANGSFRVARLHTRVLIAALAERYGRVHVIQHGGLDKCVSACYMADPDTAAECECSCAGGNHGSKQPLGLVVASVGDAGELSVARSSPREWDVYRR